MRRGGKAQGRDFDHTTLKKYHLSHSWFSHYLVESKIEFRVQLGPG